MMSGAMLAGLAGLAAWLGFAPVPGRSGSPVTGGRRTGRLIAGSAGIVFVLTQVVRGTGLVLALIAVGVAAGVMSLLRRRSRAAAADEVRDLVLAACEGMAADLAAGQTAPAALARAATEWPPLAAAARAADLGGDVGAALRRIATQPGAEAVRVVAAAWQVSQRSGAGLAAALSQCVLTMRERRRTSRLVATELASATATARLMAVLPIGVLLMGSGVGGDPVGWLLQTPVGLGCLATGATLALLGLAWLQRISDAVLTQ